MPWRVVRVAFLLADAMPRLRKMISASARLPLASVRAVLHSIMPAPVRSRSSFTSFALISIDSVRSLVFWVPSREPDRQSTAGFGLLFGHARRHRAGLFRLFRSRALAGQRH